MKLINADELALKLRHMGYMDENEEVQEVIDNFPKEYTWTLVKEGLPDLIYEGNSEYGYSDEVLVTDGNNMMVAFYREDAHSWDNYCFGWVEHDAIMHEDYPFGIGEVIAWMPLPEKLGDIL